MNQPEEAIENFDQALSRSSADQKPVFGKAAAAYQLGRFGAAEECYLSVLKHHPDNDEAMANLAALALEARDYPRAREYAQRLISTTKPSDTILQILIELATVAGDEESVAQHSAQLVELTPESFDRGSIWGPLARRQAGSKSQWMLTSRPSRSTGNGPKRLRILAPRCTSRRISRKRGSSTRRRWD